MPDRENVIRELRDIDMFIVGRLEYEKAKKFLRTIDETIILLKEQEAPSKEELISHYGKMYKCKRCGLEWYQQTQKYCQECGTAVKWE